MDVRKKNSKKHEFTSEAWLTQGEQWGYTCVKRESNFFVCFAVGKQTQFTCRRMLSEFAGRIKQPSAVMPLEIYSDGNDDYTTVLAELFDTAHISYGQLIKVREHGRVVGKIRKAVYGHPSQDDIDTVYVENYNGILRGSLGRLVRKTKCIGKRVSRVENAIYLYQFYWNFIKPIHGKLTPALLEDQATKVWTWGNFLHAKLGYTY